LLLLNEWMTTMAQEPQQPESPETPSQSSPSGWHNELKVFEADRRTRYQSNLESLTLHWKAHCDLLDTSVHETAKAYRLVLGVSKAHERMATTLSASAVSASTPNEQQQQQQQTHLSSLEEANVTMIQHFSDSATTMETNVASSLNNLLQTIQATQQQVSKEGKQMLKVLEKHEAQVEQAWGKLLLILVTLFIRFPDTITTLKEHTVVCSDGLTTHEATTIYYTPLTLYLWFRDPSI
jgi:hypothetical protein